MAGFLRTMLLSVIVIMFVLAGCIKNDTEHTNNVIRNNNINNINEYSETYDIIVMGEEHDNAFHHKSETALFKALSSEFDIALAMEMFERDVQPVMDSFLTGLITEEHFLENSRPWGNYQTDYREMVMFAKDNNIDIICANIPRPLAAEVSRTGNVQNTDSSLFDIPYPDSTSYSEKFMSTMEGIGGPMGMIDPELMFKAQLYKDATMAGSITNYLDNNKDKKVFFICGRFHSDNRLGTVHQIESMSAYKILVTSFSNENGSVEDYIVVETE